MGNKKNIKSIQQLIEELIEEKSNFLIDDYQRGYKWSTTEVTQLLNDIHEFEGNGFYCLQPVVVKRKMDGKIELIDGQQRVTTIYIILSCLSLTTKYEIDYATRLKSQLFLKNISQLEDGLGWGDYLQKGTNKDNDNIDNYHFFQANDTIKKWLADKSDSEKKVFQTKLLDKVKVIWYEVPDTGKDEIESKQESIKIFTRINSGKILLTNAELIKALFLINVEQGKNAETLQLKQNEIAQQWDAIEYALQDDAFWYFLSNKSPTATRIDFVFDLIIENKEDTDTSIKKEDKLYTFLHYTDSFSKEKDKAIWVETEWEKVKITFQNLKEWYEGREHFHLIGFLVASKILSIKQIFLAPEKEKSKAEFKKWLIDEIKTVINAYDIDKLSYNDNNDKKKINNLLLLYNIQTELNNGESNSRYQFNQHKKCKWSLEHIQAQKENTINSDDGIKKYVADFIEFVAGFDRGKDSTRNDIKDPKEIKKLEQKLIEVEQFQKRQNEIIEISKRKEKEADFSKLTLLYKQFLVDAKNVFEELFELHSLDNMALLSASINSSIGNGFFNEKRNKIIEFDKQGAFIPICTKNVFLKYYSKESKTNLFYWSSKDRDDYLEDIQFTLKEYTGYVCKTDKEIKK